MTDVKISNLPAAITPLDGTEVTPIVQSGTTKKVSIANVTAGRAISANSLTLTTPLSVANGGTGVTGSTGTGPVVLNTTPTFATSVLFPDGSVSAPSIAHAGDTNCGFYFGTDTIYATTNGTNALTVDSSQNVSVVGTLVMGSSFLRNRIINGDMRIDQRNAGASVTFSSASVSQYMVDRFYVRAETGAGNKLSSQQSTTAPTGFVNSLLLTSLSAYSIGASEHAGTIQIIEGVNISDLDWGTANAKTITLSFWARSSLTGKYGGFLANNGTTRVYIFEYNINSANTWEYKTIVIPGDTSGTWLTNTNQGIYVSHSIAAGSSVTGSSGSWGSFYRSVTGQTNVLGTNGATFYITGVQLEVGSIATPFERRQYGTELMLCQRYTQVLKENATFPGYARTTTDTYSVYQYPVVMRAAPGATFTAASTFGGVYAGTFFDASAVALDTVTVYNCIFKFTGSGFTAGWGGNSYAKSGGTIILSAEL